MERIPTHCKAVDDLLDGGLATGTITQVFGEKALGKSIFFPSGSLLDRCRRPLGHYP
jgi:KaiC/GvpD/RAD55 family RecA-like ATPase